MKALWHLDEKHSAILPFEASSLEGSLYTSCYSMISIGTEQKVANGFVDNALLGKMGVPYMEGDFDLPIKYGYSLVVQNDENQRFHLLHPHQDQVQVDPHVCFPIPSEIPAQRAALISNLETVVNAYWDGAPQKDERVAICGFGNIGALLAVTLEDTWGISPKIIEVKEWNRLKAVSLGFEIDQDESYDVIFHTSGSSNGMQYCLDHLLQEGRLVELSWYGSTKVELDLSGAFHYKRLQIISSQVSSIPKAYSDRFDFSSRKSFVVELLKNPKYDQLISRIIPFNQSASFFNKLRLGEIEDGLIWLIAY